MKYHIYVKSNVGKIRSNNEDNAYINGYYRRDSLQNNWEYTKEVRNDLLIAVFDGMGGYGYGEEASKIAAEKMMEYDDGNISESMTAYIKDVNDCIRNNEMNCTMGTTFAGLIIENDRVIFVNVGDSRGYFYRNHRLKQMTEDHNLVQQMLSKGLMTKEAAKKHPLRHSIYQFLGMDESNGDVEAFWSKKIVAKSGDGYLLCTDGLTDMLEDIEIDEILQKEKSGEQVVESLLEEALKNGGKDNITIIYIEVEESTE